MSANNGETPLDDERRQQIIAATAQYIDRAARLYGIDLPLIPVRFDLRGRASGMYKVIKGKSVIRYNPYIFAHYFDHHMPDTIAHEVAHYVTDMRHGMTSIKPHGVEWRAIMVAFGANTAATFDHSLAGVPLRQHRRVSYTCACAEHALGIRRHNKLVRGLAVYKCRHCHQHLVLASAGDGD